MLLSSNGLGHQTFNLAIGVRLSVGALVSTSKKGEVHESKVDDFNI